MKECIANNFDIFLMGLVIGLFLMKLIDLAFWYSEVKLIQSNLELNKLLAESLLKMKERIENKEERK